MRKFLFYSTDSTDACSWYRGVGPFSQLWRRNWEMVRCPPQVNWAAVSGAEIAVMQRPFSPEHVKMAAIIKRQMPLILDYDDDFTDVPISNPAHAAFSNPIVQDSLSQLMDMADLVMVSTPYLAERLMAKTKRITVVRNAYNDYLLPKTPPTEPRQKVVLWRGSETHMQDLLTVADAIVEVAGARPDWRFIFLGAPPWMLQKRMAAQWVTTQGIFEYHDLVRDQIRPALCMVPLDDNHFNRAKSDVAWLETTMAGGVCVVPRFLVEMGDVAVTYSDPEQFGAKLTEALDMFTENTQPAVFRRLSLNATKQERMLSTVNLRRASILTELTK